MRVSNLRAAALAATILSVACSSSPREAEPADASVDVASTPVQRAELAPSASARERAAELARLTRIMVAENAPPTREPIIGKGLVTAFEIEGTQIVPRVPAGGVDVRLPKRANDPVWLRDASSGVELAFTLNGAKPTEVEVADGIALYAKATADGSDIVHRVRGDGTEDYIVLEKKPTREELRYTVDVRKVAGVRRIANVVEFLTKAGRPALRVATPFVVDAKGDTHEATVRVDGCVVLTDESAPAPSPGSDTCEISVSWSIADRPACAATKCDELAYPVVVDPLWSSAGTMATPRRLFALAAISRDVLIGGDNYLAIGGLNGTAVLSSCEQWDYATNLWKPGPTLTQARYGHTVNALADSSLLVAGGMTIASPETATVKAELLPYVSSTGEHATAWSATDDMKTARAYHTATKLLGNIIFVAGGHSGVALSAAEWYDPAQPIGSKWLLRASMGAARRLHTGTLLSGGGGRVLVTGGSGGGELSTAETYFPSDNTWTTLASRMTSARQRHAAIALSGTRVLLAGGYSGTATLSSADIFDFGSGPGTFAATVAMSVPRQMFTLSTLYGGRYLAAGGWSPMQSTGEVFIDGTTKSWAPAEVMSSMRGQHAAVTVSSGGVLVAGGVTTDTLTTTNSAQLFRLLTDGASCTDARVCSSGYCVNGACCSTSSCPTGSTCNYVGAAGSCRKNIGQPCAANGECGSYRCADGVCCNTTCGGSCDRCNLTGYVGTCRNAALGTPGNPACANNFVCNGATGACPTSCTGDQMCASGYYCTSGACVAKLGLGATCTSNNQCALGNCIDGFCCNNACGGACDRCNLATKGTCSNAAAGTVGSPTCGGYLCNGSTATCPTSCTADTNCASGYYCNGTTCVAKKADGVACVDKKECVSTFCADGYCCNSACSNACDRCNLTGLRGSCSNALAGASGEPTACAGNLVCTGGAPTCPTTCSSDSHCVSTHYCSGTTCLAKKANGVACTLWNQCSSGNCADGVCCNAACDQACDRCNLTGSVGTCQNAPSGSAGSPVCAGSLTCTGTTPTCPGGCTTDASCASGSYCSGGTCLAKKPAGATCTAINQCSSNFCVDGVCCGTACSGACDRCNITAGGVCTNVTAGTPGSPACMSSFVCNGSSGACPTTCTSDSHCVGTHYCVGGACVVKKTTGATCTGGNQCASGNCVDGVCCNTACTASCDRCNLTGSLGTCGNAAAGTPGQPACPDALVCAGGSATCPTTCASDAGCASGYFCNAGTCTLRKSNGDACSTATQCVSGFCIDGVCCNSACAGACMGCSATVKGQGANGVCEAVRAGTDPKDSCAADSVNPCGDDGACNGSGACRKHSYGTPCGATTCVSTDTTKGRICDGIGTCVDSLGTSCAPYVCKGSACVTPCVTSDDCVTGFFCAGGTCLKKRTQGELCGANADCTTGFCVDGVCCNSACTGSCLACGEGMKEDGSAAGTCGPAKKGSDPRDECTDEGPLTCGRTGTCDGKGACALYASGTLCGTTACESNTAVRNACDGAGVCARTAKDCLAYKCIDAVCATTCTIDDDCGSNAYCNVTTSECVARKPKGDACAEGRTCATGYCVDGVCCDAACGGQCEACDTTGTCVPVSGKPRGARPACPDTGSANVCEARACNGSERATCEGLAGSSVTCAAAKCSNGVASLAAKCDGSGKCETQVEVKCEPYVCFGDRCGTAPCATDDDCSAKFRCDPVKKDCVPKDAALCSADNRKLIGADGREVDCAPYTCEGGKCLQQCTGSAQCAPAFVCETALSPPQCVAQPSEGGDDGGCGCSTPGRSGEGAASIVALLGMLVARRRRRART